MASKRRNSGLHSTQNQGRKSVKKSSPKKKNPQAPFQGLIILLIFLTITSSFVFMFYNLLFPDTSGTTEVSAAADEISSDLSDISSSFFGTNVGSAQQPQTEADDSAAAVSSNSSSLTSGTSGSADNPELYYFYSIMNQEDRDLYDQIYQAIINRQTQIKVSEDDSVKLGSAVCSVLADHPELFWVDNSYSYSRISGQPISELTLSYAKSEDDQKEIQSDIDSALEDAMKEISKHSSEKDKAKAAFDYVIRMVEYDLGSEDNQYLHSALVNKKSVCAGYAKELQYLLQNAGIQAVYVSGTVFPGNEHAWVIAKIEGNYYHLDPTCGDNDSVYQGASKNDLSNYNYFLQPDSTMMRQRTYDLRTWSFPECTDEQYKSDEPI